VTKLAEARVHSTSGQQDIIRLCEAIEKADPRAVCRLDAGRAEFPLGSATTRVEPHLLVLNAEAADEEGLATVKFLMAIRLDEIATEKPNIVWTGDGSDAKVLPNFSEMRVRRWRHVTPRIRRITLGGGEHRALRVGERACPRAHSTHRPCGARMAGAGSGWAPEMAGRRQAAGEQALHGAQDRCRGR
jgi:hypothetical protein